MSRPVVVSADRFPADRAALTWAAAEARRRRAPLHVVTTRQGAGGAERSVLADALVEVSSAVPHLPLLGRTARGRTQDVLRAVSADAEAVVVPASAPVIDAVVGSAYCPVFAVPDEPGEGAPDRGAVVLGVAPWTGDEVVERAFAEAARRRAPLLAVRAAVTGSAEDARWELEMALSACRIVHPDVEVDPMVTAGRAADVLVSLSRAARLLVLGRSTRGALLAGLVGSPVRDLLRAAGCPVLVVPSDGPPHPSLLPGRRGRAFSGR